VQVPRGQFFCDANHGDVSAGLKSTSGVLLLWQSAAVLWRSQVQKTIAWSTTEAEYQAAGAAARDVLWLRQLLPALGEDTSGPTIIHTDSQPALSLLKAPRLTERSKHIDIIHHFARERVLAGELHFKYVHTSENPADALTKPVPRPKLIFCRTAMGLRSLVELGSLDTLDSAGE